jgi:hypothetical protein
METRGENGTGGESRAHHPESSLRKVSHGILPEAEFSTPRKHLERTPGVLSFLAAGFFWARLFNPERFLADQNNLIADGCLTIS